MPEERKQIFREQSLEKLSSPDRLDQLLRVVRPHAWVSLIALGAGILLAVLWSIFGRIPSTVNGTGILVRPKQVVPFQTPSSGQLATITATVGTVVHKGDLLATLHLPNLEEQLKLEEIKLEQASERTGKMTDLERSLAESQRAHIRLQRDLIDERIKGIDAAAKRFKGKSDEYIKQERASVAVGKETAGQLAEALDERLAARMHLLEFDPPLIGQDQVLEIRERVIANQLHIADLAAREHEVELRENNALESYERQMDLIRDLDLDRNELELEELVITRRLNEDALQSESEIQAIERNIEELKVRLHNESRVESPYDGTVLEITASTGEQLAIGERLGKIEIDDPSAKLMTLAYFSIKDGKRLETGLPIRIAPSTVERERFGSIKGTVIRVSDYPVTTAAASHQIGDFEMARALLGGESRIEVMAELLPDESTATHFLWTSGRGPTDARITAGTTAQVRVTVEELAPITLILPFLRSASGI